MNAQKRALRFAVTKILGLLLSVFACVIIWQDYEYNSYFLFIKTTKYLHTIPNLISGSIGAFITFILFCRNILIFRPIQGSISERIISIASILVNICFFSTISQLIVDPIQNTVNANIVADNIVLILIITACMATIFFGVKEMAKIALLILVTGTCINNIRLVSSAMGVWGFIALLISVASFLLQDNIHLSNLYHDMAYLFTKSSRKVQVTIKNAKEEADRLL